MFIIIEKSEVNNIIGGTLDKSKDVDAVRTITESCEDKECQKGKIKIIIL